MSKKKMVGVRGFEPPASASRTQRSSQTEPHPDIKSIFVYRSSNALPVSTLPNIHANTGKASSNSRVFQRNHNFFERTLSFRFRDDIRIVLQGHVNDATIMGVHFRKFHRFSPTLDLLGRVQSLLFQLLRRTAFTFSVPETCRSSLSSPLSSSPSARGTRASRSPFA